MIIKVTILNQKIIFNVAIKKENYFKCYFIISVETSKSLLHKSDSNVDVLRAYMTLVQKQKKITR